MPVTIDEITAEIEPTPQRANAAPASSNPPPSPETQRQRLEDLTALVRSRAQRLKAD